MAVPNYPVSYPWYEVWSDDADPTPYVLIVRPSPEGRGIVIVDPQKGHKIIRVAEDYASAVLWLSEDEYTRVEGRMGQSD